MREDAERLTGFRTLVTKTRVNISVAKCEPLLSDQLINFDCDYFGTSDFIPLHAPIFLSHELEYVADNVESAFVFIVGEYVDRFERV